MASSFPPIFHRAMIPDLRAPEELRQGDADAEEAAEDAENQVWQAKVTALRAQLEADQKAVKSMAAGHKVLRDQSLGLIVSYPAQQPGRSRQPCL